MRFQPVVQRLVGLGRCQQHCRLNTRHVDRTLLDAPFLQASGNRGVIGQDIAQLRAHLAVVGARIGENDADRVACRHPGLSESVQHSILRFAHIADRAFVIEIGITIRPGHGFGHADRIESAPPPENRDDR
ncbi:MAG: hypothetical protein ABS93_02930 [Thiobacillus sp. SCN 62-729]|nr:MAG: hypothetical protein ABS93_02930 [Thiobacillus sp. SCN 62-729]